MRKTRLKCRLTASQYGCLALRLWSLWYALQNQWMQSLCFPMRHAWQEALFDHVDDLILPSIQSRDSSHNTLKAKVCPRTSRKDSIACLRSFLAVIS